MHTYTQTNTLQARAKHTFAIVSEYIGTIAENMNDYNNSVLVVITLIRSHIMYINILRLLLSLFCFVGLSRFKYFRMYATSKLLHYCTRDTVI